MGQIRVLLVIGGIFLASISLFAEIPMPEVAGKTRYMSLASGQRALVYEPVRYRPYVHTPVIIALHGLKEDEKNALAAWHKVADELGVLLLCPRASSRNDGYLHGEVDDRKNVLQFWKMMGRKYRVDYDHSILVGFSRGGNFALELALFYPRYFPRVVSYFGFFNGYSRQILRRNAGSMAYARSRFYFVTGTKDLTLASNKKGATLLRDSSITVKVQEYPDLIHGYPADLLTQFRTVQSWMF